MTDAEIKRVLEALLLVAEKPLLPEQAQEALGPQDNGGQPAETTRIRELFAELAQEYAQGQRGLRIVEVAQGFQLVTDSALVGFVTRLTHRVRSVRLSRPSLETLAIVAYRQPLTRVEIEGIRGVDCSGVLETLVKLNLIRIEGRKETVGRPLLYGTTREFLEHFGLKNLEGLPSLQELKGIPTLPAPVSPDDTPTASKTN